MDMNKGMDDFFSDELPGMESVIQTPQEPAVKETPVLTPVEQEIYDKFSEKEKMQLRQKMDEIDFNDPNMRSQYAMKTREKIAQISDQSLQVARTRDLGVAGQSITTLIGKLENIDLEGKKRGWFGRARSAFEEFKIQLASVEDNIAKSVVIMEGHKNQLRADNGVYDTLYNKNLGLYRALTRYIILGKLKLDEERKTTLAALQAKTKGKDAGAIEAFSDYKQKLDDFERLLDELESTKLQCLQTAPMLRIAKSNNEALIEKFDFIFLTAVPSWKTQLQLMLAQENTRQAGKAIDAAVDFNNEIIRRNAELLGQNTVAVARITEREITETATLEFANRKLLESMNEVLQIHAEGRAKRAQSRLDKARMEQEMKDELLKFANG